MITSPRVLLFRIRSGPFCRGDTNRPPSSVLDGHTNSRANHLNKNSGGSTGRCASTATKRTGAAATAPTRTEGARQAISTRSTTMPARRAQALRKGTASAGVYSRVRILPASTVSHPERWPRRAEETAGVNHAHTVRRAAVQAPATYHQVALRSSRFSANETADQVIRQERRTANVSGACA